MQNDLAPIVLFTYNRPIHTQNLLDSLASNPESQNSSLYVYIDGPKFEAEQDTLNKINNVATIIEKENRFKEIIIIKQSANKGLAASIIEGVTYVVNKHNKVIVLEDDLILSKFFLAYMNDSLTRYENNDSIAQIGACNFFACGEKYPNFFFLAMSECWGWATWKNKWSHFNPNAIDLLEQLKEKKLEVRFNAYGSYNMIGMLEDQMSGKVNSWAIRWQAVCVLNNWLTLYPNPSLSQHIDSNEATHAKLNIAPPLFEVSPNFEDTNIVEDNNVVEAMKKGYSNSGDYYGNPVKKKLKLLKKIKLFFKKKKERF